MHHEMTKGRKHETKQFIQMEPHWLGFECPAGTIQRRSRGINQAGYQSCETSRGHSFVRSFESSLWLIPISYFRTFVLSCFRDCNSGTVMGHEFEPRNFLFENSTSLDQRKAWQRSPCALVRASGRYGGSRCIFYLTGQCAKTMGSPLDAFRFAESEAAQPSRNLRCERV